MGKHLRKRIFLIFSRRKEQKKYGRKKIASVENFDFIMQRLCKCYIWMQWNLLILCCYGATLIQYAYSNHILQQYCSTSSNYYYLLSTASKYTRSTLIALLIRNLALCHTASHIDRIFRWLCDCFRLRACYCCRWLWEEYLQVHPR